MARMRHIDIRDHNDTLADDTIGYQLQDAGGTLRALIFITTGNLLYTSTIEGASTAWDLDHPQGQQRLSKNPAGIMAIEISRRQLP